MDRKKAKDGRAASVSFIKCAIGRLKTGTPGTSLSRKLPGSPPQPHNGDGKTRARRCFDASGVKMIKTKTEQQ